MGLIGAFDAVLELIVFSGQEQRELVVSGSRVAKRRRVPHTLSYLEFMAAHVVFPKTEPQAREICTLSEFQMTAVIRLVLCIARLPRLEIKLKYFSSRKSLSGRRTEFRC